MFMEPRGAEAELLYTDTSWRAATVLGWYRLDVARQQVLTKVWVFWLVHIRLADGSEGWYEYDQRNIRPQRSR